jgi:hypothetical protein
VNDWLSTSTVTGIVFWGVVAAAAFSFLVWLSRVHVTKLLRRLALHLPVRTHPSLRLVLDTIYPMWRSDTGERHARASLDIRLSDLQAQNHRAAVIVGSVYLDITVGPIHSDALSKSEYGNLDRVKTDCGGAAVWVGRRLFDYQEKSFLFSRVGKGDPFSQDLTRRLNGERWIKGGALARAEGIQSGISVHLVQPGKMYTTFTHRGALNSLGWEGIMSGVLRAAKHGGILFISGYFRTNLCDDLRRSLESLPPRLVVCLDHGRFMPRDNERALFALRDAFQQKAIDIYLCTYSDLASYLAGVAPDSRLGTRPAAML